MFEFCFVLYTLCCQLEFSMDMDTIVCFLIRNVSWTGLDGEHPQGWIPTILILLYSAVQH